jgi:hypothetical protein
MYKKKLRLREFVENYYEMGMAEKLNRLVQIRTYINTQRWNDLADEIRALQNVDEVKVCLGAGMKGVLYMVAMKKLAELSGQ